MSTSGHNQKEASVKEEEGNNDPKDKTSGSESSEEDFEIEKILFKRFNGRNQPEYYIKWKNYDDSWNTWEPLESFNARELLEDFEENWKKSGPDHSEFKNGVFRETPYHDKIPVTKASVEATAGPSTAVTPKKLKVLKKRGRPKKIKGADGVSTAGSSSGSNNHQKIKGKIHGPNEPMLIGFKRDLEAEKIVGVTVNSQQQLLFLIKWSVLVYVSHMIIINVFSSQSTPGKDYMRQNWFNQKSVT